VIAVEAAAGAALGLLAVALLFALVRIVRGPSLADRVVALDVVSATIVSVATVTALRTGQAVFVDVSLAIALVAFLATVAFARHMEEEAEE